MKLKFTKDENGDILLTVNEEKFNTNDYLEVVKNIKDGQKLELESFEETISQEEQESIEKMIKEINLIGNNDDDTKDREAGITESSEEDIGPNDF